MLNVSHTQEMRGAHNRRACIDVSIVQCRTGGYQRSISALESAENNVKLTGHLVDTPLETRLLTSLDVNRNGPTAGPEDQPLAEHNIFSLFSTTQYNNESTPEKLKLEN